MPTQGEARSRQTAYLATEHWWRSRVEAIARKWREDPPASQPWDTFERAEDYAACAAELDALIAERNPR